MMTLFRSAVLLSVTTSSVVWGVAFRRGGFLAVQANATGVGMMMGNASDNRTTTITSIIPTTTSIMPHDDNAVMTKKAPWFDFAMQHVVRHGHVARRGKGGRGGGRGGKSRGGGGGGFGSHGATRRGFFSSCDRRPTNTNSTDENGEGKEVSSCATLVGAFAGGGVGAACFVCFCCCLFWKVCSRAREDSSSQLSSVAPPQMIGHPKKLNGQDDWHQPDWCHPVTPKV